MQQICAKLVLLLCVLLFAQSHAAPPSVLDKVPRKRQVLLISLDGFRHDYLTMYASDSKFLRRMASNGVYVKAMQTEFTTKTFPNHWTIVTGRHQESHGIVSNGMYDPVYNATFSMSTLEERWWNDTEPIWITAKRQGLKVATFFWPGSQVSFGGFLPDHYFAYNGSMTYEYRIETVVRWITEENIDLTTLYFNEPDSSGHSFGPGSQEVANAIRRLDFLLQYLYDRLEESGYEDSVDIIVTSDHGMTALSPTRVVNFNNTLSPYVARYMDSGPLLSLFAKPGMRDQLVEFLNNQTSAKSLPIRVFTKDSLPQSYHYSNHRRIPDVLVLPAPGYAVFGRSTPLLKGNHGFDNGYDEMKVPLIAIGSSFRQGQVVEGFRQVDIYGLMCYLLRIEPQPNNGSLTLLPQMLRRSAARDGCSGVLAMMATVAALLVRSL